MVNYFVSRYAGDYDSVYAKLGAREEVASDGKSLRLQFGKNIIDMDEDGMKIKILRAILTAAMRMKLPGFILVSFADKKIIREGFSREITRYYFCSLAARKKRVESFGDFLDINLPWISFKGIDEYTSLFFRQSLGKFEYDERFESESGGLFSLLSRPLTSSVLQQIISEYGGDDEQAGNKIQMGRL